MPVNPDLQPMHIIVRQGCGTVRISVKINVVLVPLDRLRRIVLENEKVFVRDRLATFAVYNVDLDIGSGRECAELGS
jgi:hypothetical protein